MRHNDVIYLIRRKITQDDIGNNVSVTTERMIYANQMSVAASEFYTAGNSGMKPEKQFEVYSFEYEGETALRHNDIDYTIIRSTGQGEKVRIICERKIGHVST